MGLCDIRCDRVQLHPIADALHPPSSTSYLAGLAEIGLASWEDRWNICAAGGTWHTQSVVCPPGAEAQVRHISIPPDAGAKL
jgi:hypothetical protein